MDQFEWGTDAWCHQLMTMAREAVEKSSVRRPELSYTSLMVVTDTPKGTLKLFEEIESGVITRMFFGDTNDADVTITLTYSDYQKIFTELKSSHELPSYAITGDVAKLAPAVALRNTEGYRRYKSYVASMTRWP